MISFYPGPSQVYPQIPHYVQEAHHAGVLSINHRSPEFMEIFRQTVALVKEKLSVPDDYTVVFTTSATECWEILGQSLVREQSFHIFNGAFGEKWHRYAMSLVSRAESHSFDSQSLPEPTEFNSAASADMVCITHNETSNGTALPSDWIETLRTHLPEPLIAVDATSSMAGVELPWRAADVWYASVQKCFGLPAGMAVLIISPRAVGRAMKLGEKKHYNSLISIYEQSQRYQTTHTPNVLNLYLLMRTLEERPAIPEVGHVIKQRYGQWIKVLNEIDYLNLLIDSDLVRSRTVIPFQTEPRLINQIRDQAKAQGMILGNGYGTLKNTTLRIANFPALKEEEINQLIAFFRQFVPTLAG